MNKAELPKYNYTNPGDIMNHVDYLLDNYPHRTIHNSGVLMFSGVLLPKFAADRYSLRNDLVEGGVEVYKFPRPDDFADPELGRATHKVKMQLSQSGHPSSVYSDFTLFDKGTFREVTKIDNTIESVEGYVHEARVYDEILRLVRSDEFTQGYLTPEGMSMYLDRCCSPSGNNFHTVRVKNSPLLFLIKRDYPRKDMSTVRMHVGSELWQIDKLGDNCAVTKFKGDDKNVFNRVNIQPHDLAEYNMYLGELFTSSN